MVGVALSIRAKEDVLSVWLRDSSNALAKIKLGYVYAARLLLESALVCRGAVGRNVKTRPIALMRCGAGMWNGGDDCRLVPRIPRFS